MERPRSRMSFLAGALSMLGDMLVPPEIVYPRQHGPGRKTLHTYWKNVRASKYRPHIGAKQRAKARARLERTNAE